MDKCEWVKELRAGLGLSQPQFAEANNLSLRALQAWEQRYRTPKLDIIFELSKKYKKPIE